MNSGVVPASDGT